MAYQKKYATKEERSAALSAAGRLGANTVKKNGTFNGGRKPAIKGDTDRTTTCTIRESDSDYINRMSFSLGLAKAACIRVLILAYRRHCAKFKAGDAVNSKLDESMNELGKFTEHL